MKLSDLIKKNNWLSIELVLLHLYPDQIEIIDQYRIVFECLLKLEPEENEMRILITKHDSDPGEETTSYFDVSGQNGTKDEGGYLISYALEFTDWKKWLGMDLAGETIHNFSEIEIIAHCLYEMTFMGYDEKEIQEEWSSINNEVQDFKSLSEDDKKGNTISFEELLKRINNNKES